MLPFDLARIFLKDLPVAFLGEVALRTVFAYFAVLLFLKLSGQRGIRQLTLFELVVILTHRVRHPCVAVQTHNFCDLAQQAP